MREEEAKELAQQKVAERFKRLFWSLSGGMAACLGLLSMVTFAYLSGYNEVPRIIIFAPTAQEYQKALTEASTDIGKAVTEIGFSNMPEESQRLLARALGNIKYVREQLVVTENSEPAIFFPKWSMLATPAYAQEAVPAASSPKENFHQTLAVIILAAITLFWIACLAVYFFSKDEKKIASSATMIQTILGFYIGVFTGLLGLPSAT